MPWKPPGGSTACSNPPGLVLLGLAVVVAGMIGDLGVVLFLVAAEVVAAFGSAVEVALENHSRSRVLELAGTGARRTLAEQRLAHVPTYELTARLLRFLGNTLFVASVAYLSFRDRLGAAAGGESPWGPVTVTMGIVLAVTFVLNDLVVRVLTEPRANRVLLTALPVLAALRVGLAPLRIPLVLVVRLVFRVNLDAPAPTAREEILESVEEGEREGSFTPEEADMIESIIGMDASLTKDVLTPRADMVMVQADATLEEALEVVKEEGFSRLPVYGNDRDDVIGVLYAHDLFEHLTPAAVGGPHVGTLRVRDVMRKPFFVPENKPIRDLLKEMRARKVHLAVVLDEFNGTEGLVTIEDVLEEIVGEIRDEFDEEEEATTHVLGAGTLRVEGRTTIEEVNERLGIALPIEDDFETMSGLIFHRLGAVPQSGERMELDGVRLTVLEADERTVQSIEVQVLADRAGIPRPEGAAVPEAPSTP